MRSRRRPASRSIGPLTTIAVTVSPGCRPLPIDVACGTEQQDAIANREVRGRVRLMLLFHGSGCSASSAAIVADRNRIERATRVDGD